MHRAVHWGDRHIPRGLRAVAGVICVLLGLVGFLPILGFWMVPVGFALIALEVPSLRIRLLAWIDRHEARRNRAGRLAIQQDRTGSTPGPGSADH